MPRSANAATSAREVSGDGGTGVPNGRTSVISQSLADAPRGEVVVQHQRGFARRRRALERRRADADDGPALRERGKHLAQPLGAGNGVELVAAFGEARRGVEVVVGAERDDQEVGLVGSAVGGDAPRFGIDRGDRLLHKAHARFRRSSLYGRRTASSVVRPNITSSFE